MPFKSEKQRRFLFANEPQIAKKWAEKYGSKSKPAALNRLKKTMSESKKLK